MIIDTDKIDKAKLVEAAAQGMVNRRASVAEGNPVTWDKLSPIAQHHVRESVLPLVNIILADVEEQHTADFAEGLKGLLDD